ncbi:LacI family transcriptional regulator [Neolewinella xylanilytica]|uniref:LacI family transcriptional regulator n=1 Tax=Neolewinella xylanilytica TaxID=1514080 RepID=A0A2S6I6L6_9BACT|nr:LacI family DNA-binding transcriptional regulator [Neolewinella xylanilytica]PPK87128.1 LacI family transcriptional regulator [Neolewinella xylanilytica]
MRNKRQSIKDIATKLGVSPTTVSFVLNGKGEEKKISKEVINRVREYTTAINYKPNMVARSLRTGRTKILVFMVEDISNYFFSRIARIIEDIAYSKGYRVLFCSNENQDKRSRDLLNLFYERQVDGFIIIPSSGIRSDIKELIDNDIPVVLFDRYFPDLDTHYVVIDNYAASKNATQHLIDNGYRNIAFITTDVQQLQMLDRKRGYLDAVSKEGLQPTVLEIPFDDTDSKKGRELLRGFFSKKDGLDAVYFSTNYLTRSGLEIIKEIDAQAIADLGIVTFDDNELFRINTPTISAVAQPMEAIAQELMRIMLHLLKHKNKVSETIQVTLSAELIPRGSSLAKEKV